MSLNTDNEGLPIAFESHGKYSNKNRFIYYDESEQANLDTDMITREHLELVYGKEAIKRKVAFQRMKEKLIDEIKEHGILKDEIRTQNNKGVFEPVPDIDVERTVWFLSGKSGSGKSYMTAQLLESYRKMGIKKVFIITTQEDEKFGNANYININDIVKVSKSNEYEKKLEKYKKAKLKFQYKKKEMMNDGADLDDIIDLQVEIEAMKPDKPKNVKSYEIPNIKAFEKKYSNSVWVFDDYENENEEKLKRIEFLRNHILTTGRHFHANMIICNHLTNFGQNSRLIMQEAHYFVLFSKGTTHSKHYFLKNYLGFDKKQIKRVTKSLSNSRSVVICPAKKYCLYQHLIYLYD